MLFRKKQKRRPNSPESELYTISTCSSRNYGMRPRNSRTLKPVSLARFAQGAKIAEEATWPTLGISLSLRKRRRVTAPKPAMSFMASYKHQERRPVPYSVPYSELVFHTAYSSSVANLTLGIELLPHVLPTLIVAQCFRNELRCKRVIFDR